MSQPKSLCVLRLSALGDCINAFGVIGALNKQYPDLKLSWVIDKRFAPCLGLTRSRISYLCILLILEPGLKNCFST